MPQYRVLQKSFIGNRIVEEGEIVDYDGDASDNLERVKKGKKAAEALAGDASGTDQGGAGEALAGDASGTDQGGAGEALAGDASGADQAGAGEGLV